MRECGLQAAEDEVKNEAQAKNRHLVGQPEVKEIDPQPIIGDGDEEFAKLEHEDAQNKPGKGAGPCGVCRFYLPIQEGDGEIEHHFHGDGPTSGDNAVDPVGIEAVGKGGGGEEVQRGDGGGVAQPVARAQAIAQEVERHGAPEERGDPAKAPDEEVARQVGFGGLADGEGEEEREGADDVEELDAVGALLGQRDKGVG